ncbi:MAG TPA: serine/threonine-protein kinase [Steroidobacteraceae bacterium]|jgi:serine/threonine-protein kinase
MDSSRWQRLQDLFHEAAQLPPAQRRACLEARCGDDPGLAAEALRLLEADARGAGLLDGDLTAVAGALLESRDEPITRRFGPYRLLRLLGEGGMGAVYLAQRAGLERVVAIKILRDAGLSPARRALFTGEQRTLARLTHPSITRLYDADISDEGVPYIVMEYVEGEPLTGYCEQHGCTLAQRLQLFRSVAGAVQYAHQHAVIHRDLKPSNVLVRPDGSVSLLDFGIAKHLAGSPEAAAQTRTTLRLMTPLYAAPEQLSGGIVGVQTDVYALGVMLYQLLTGQVPFDVADRSAAQAERLLSEQPPERPSARARRQGVAGLGGADAIGAGAWADLDVLCLTAMHRDPAQRYASVEALLRDLDHYLRSEPLEARPDSWRYRGRKFIGRHRTGVTVSAAVLAAAIALVSFFSVRLHGAHQQALMQAQRAQRIQSFVTSLFHGGEADAGPAESLRVLTLLDRGAEEAAGLGAEPAVQADIYETLGKLYGSLGQLERADALLTSSLTLRRTLFGATSPELAPSLTALAVLRLEQDNLGEAERLARDAVRHVPAGRGDPARVHALVALGRVQAERGAYDDAIRTLDSAVAASSAPGAAPPDLAASLGALANAQYQAGHYQPARTLYERALMLDRRLHGDKHPAVANDLNSLASIQQDLGYYPQAEQLARQALKITSAYYGPDHPKTAAGLTILGRALLYQKEYGPAEDALQRALAIQELRFGPVHAAVADTLNELGNIASLNEDYPRAQGYFQRVADIYRSIHGEQHYLVAIALSNVAYVQLNRKEYAGAEAGFRDVIGRFTATLGPDNLNTGIAHIKLGRTLLREQRFAEARDQTLAGYDNLMHQANPGISFLQAARKDLAAEYGALHEPQLAQRYRAELAANEAPPARARVSAR